MADKFFDAMFTAAVIGGSSGPAPVIIAKNITANGTYSAADDQANGYDPVIVDVPNTYTAGDEGKVVDNGQLVAQTAYPSTITKNGTYNTTENNSVTVDVDTSGSGLVLSTVKCTPSTTKFKSENWISKTWSGYTGISGDSIWTDGENVYYSDGNNHYVLDKSTSTWSTKTWSGYTRFNGNQIWTDGENIYYSDGNNHYVLDKSTSTWSTKTWSGYTSVSGYYIWTDGESIYYSCLSEQYILDKATSTWSTKSWSGLTRFNGNQIWTDGENIYYSDGINSQYILNKSTSTWTTKTWSGGYTPAYGTYIWTDGEGIYYSYSANNYVLNKSTSTWSTKTWSEITNFTGIYIWTDGDNIYYSNSSNQYVLDKQVYNAPISTHTPSTKT